MKDSRWPARHLGASRWNIILGVLISCFFVLFSGCKTIPGQPRSDAIATTIYLEPAAGSRYIPANDFNIVGRIAIQDEKQSFSGSFRWQHLAASDEILLFTPLGQAVAEITKDHDGVRLITSKLEAFYAPDVENLTEQILGWRLPVEGLQYWIQGVHSPITAAEKDLDRKDQIITIRQDGWHIHYSSYIPVQPDQTPLPRALHLFYENENLKIRLIIDNWKVE